MKKLIAWAMTLILSLSLFALPVAAVEPAADPNTPAAGARADEAVWYTRVYEGKLQKRLWSTAYNMWLTDWIDVE